MKYVLKSNWPLLIILSLMAAYGFVACKSAEVRTDERHPIGRAGRE